MAENNHQENRLQAIWYVVSQIPRGKVASYGQVARLAGLPGLSRYVGYALKQLPEDTAIPWHRVINSQGRISFPEGSSRFYVQQSRLTGESVTVSKGRISLRQFGWMPD